MNLRRRSGPFRRTEPAWAASLLLVFGAAAAAQLPDEAESPDSADEPVEAPIVRGADDAPAGPTSFAPSDEALARAALDEDAEVRLNFVGQPWRGVLEWIAEKSGMSLDWQELPEGELNLRTQRSYTLSEVRDLIRMHLMARGYTLVRRGEVLSVVKLEDLEPTIVPRVSPEELDERDDYEFVKVTFPLEWIPAEDAAEELQPLVSTHGKLVPLTATNQIEAVDAVVHLRDVRDMLTREESDDSRERLVAEFPLQHAKATDVIAKLEGLLGLETPLHRMSEDQRRAMYFRTAQQAELARRMGDKAPVLGRQEESDVNLVVNERQNSIVANAPPDKIALIRQAVEVLDVPSGESESVLDDAVRMKAYRIEGIDPEPMVELLEELRALGKIAPDARFEEDDDSSTLFAYASLADHLTIASVVDQLTGSARSFHVIPLRRLDAAYVAEAMAPVMSGWGVAERRRWGRDSDDRASGLRVEADVAENRLLVWANEAELEEVENVLAKLGEPAQTVGGDPVRILDLGSGDETDEALERLRRVWPRVGRNPLELHGNDGASAYPTGTEGEECADETEFPAENEPDDEDLSVLGAVALAAVEPAGAEDESCAPEDLPEGVPSRRNSGAAAPPVTITPAADGRLVIASQDPRALDQVERLLEAFGPQRGDYTIFPLENVPAYSIQTTLEQIFGVSPDGESSRYSALTFVADYDTNSLLVTNASPKQLRRIEELVDYYDRSEPADPETVRTTEIFDLEHASAAVVVGVVKDVYRDLLSENDDAFRRPGGEERGGDDRERRPAPPQGYSVYSLSDDIARKMPTYKGMLSVGLYEPMNRLVVSAPKFLMEDIRALVEDLDDAAGGQRVSIMRIDGSMNEAEVHEVLSNLVGDPTDAAPPRISTGGAGSFSRRDRGDDDDDDDRRRSSLDIRRRGR